MDAILLAAGNSTRFGENKLLYSWNGKELYRYGLDLLVCLQQEQKIRRLLLVTQYDAIIAVCGRSYPTVTIVRNRAPELGISHSIALGLFALDKTEPASDACLFFVADQPELTKTTIIKFVMSWEVGKSKILACACGKTVKNPVIFSADFYRELSELTGDTGGKQIILRYPQKTELFQAAEKELEDIDTKPERI